MKLTPEQKTRFAPMLRRTYGAIADDAGRLSVRGIIEVTCDANRPVTFGGMSKDDYELLCLVYYNRDTQKWLRSVLNY